MEREGRISPSASREGVCADAIVAAAASLALLLLFVPRSPLPLPTHPMNDVTKTGKVTSMAEAAPETVARDDVEEAMAEAVLCVGWVGCGCECLEGI